MSLDFLFEMAWKSALIAGVALGLVAILRSRAAADRAAVLRVSVGLLLLLPLVSLGLPKLQIEAWAPEEVAAAPASASFALPAPEAASAFVPELAAAPATGPIAAPTIWDDPTILFLILYLGGVAMAAARLGAGLWTLGRWTRGSREVSCPQWMEAFERARWAAGAPRRLRLLVSDEAPSPLSWGLLHPVILIDRDSLDEPEDADAILAHEIAHVVRRDWLVLMLTRTAAALFWFNPLVWVLEREVVQQAEEAADIEAALWVEPTRYAQTLVHWAQFNAGGLVPANSIAPSASGLARRVRAILDARRRSTPTGSPWTLAAIGGCATFAMMLAVLQLIPAAAEAHHSADAPVAPAAPAALPATPPLVPSVAAPAGPMAPGAAPLAVTAPGAPAAPPMLSLLHGKPGMATPPALPAAPATPSPPSAIGAVAPPAPPAPPRVRVALRQATRAMAIAQVDVDQLVAARIHGVDASYIRAMAEANAALRRVDLDELVAMRIHGVSPAFVREMAAAGYPNLDAATLVSMRIHGVSAGEARRAAHARGRRLSPNELVSRAIHGGDDEDGDEDEDE